MPRRSKRKQNRKKSHKQNSSKKIKYNLEKQSKKNVNRRLNGPAPHTSNIENSYQNKSLQFEFESDSDPDVFFEFHPDIELNRAKSDSALSKLSRYVDGLKLFCGSESTSRECSDAGNTEIQASIDSCRNTLTESVSTTRTVNSSDLKLTNKIKSNSTLQFEMSAYRSSRDLPLLSHLVRELQKDEIHLKDVKMMTNIQGGIPLLTSSEETINSKVEKSYDNLNQQITIMKLSDEALELGISAIPPKRLSSSSNIPINNHTAPGSCMKQSFTGLETIPDKTVYSCNNQFFKTSGKTSEQGFRSEQEVLKEITSIKKSLGLVGDIETLSRQYSEELMVKELTELLMQKNTKLCKKSSKIESNIYLKSTKNEKHLLNCSLLGEEPQSRSTPILKISKSKEKWKKSLQEANLSINSETAIEEYHTCRKEFFEKEESQEPESCLSQYVSCWDVSNSTKEILKIFPPECENSRTELLLKASLKDVSIQCELLKTDSKAININEEEGREKESEEEKEQKTEEKTDEEILNVSLTGTDHIRHSQANFETFRRLFTRISIQKFLHVLSILPMDKILEFFCLTFSIPLIETMAISISVTKVMNVLSATALVPNFNEKLKNYKSKAADCLRASWTNLAELFVKYQSDEIDSLSRENRMCLCDTQKMTDLEKRLKNLENELTKFQYVDAEIEKLKEIANNFQQVAVRSMVPEVGIVVPPPPPPPPPPPSAPMFRTSLIKPKKTQKPQDSVSRPSITVEDLQKVILRKVTTNEKQAPEPKKGPVVSLEMLRSVKLRSSAKKKTPTCSPTRTPTSRERIRRIKSPFRSSSRSRDRKSRYPNIPLSEILSMDDSYQIFDQKNAETQRIDSSIFY